MFCMVCVSFLVSGFVLYWLVCVMVFLSLSFVLIEIVSWLSVLVRLCWMVFCCLWVCLVMMVGVVIVVMVMIVIVSSRWISENLDVRKRVVSVVVFSMVR